MRPAARVALLTITAPERAVTPVLAAPPIPQVQPVRPRPPSQAGAMAARHFMTLAGTAAPPTPTARRHRTGRVGQPRPRLQPAVTAVVATMRMAHQQTAAMEAAQRQRPMRAEAARRRRLQPRLAERAA